MSESEAARGVFWVAGVGASAGLGAALARRFARAGYVAVVSGRTQARLDAVAREIRDGGGQAFAVPLDVGKEADVVAAAKQVSELGRLAAAVFNASTMVAAPSLELRASDFEDALRINVLGGFLFAREVLRSLSAQGRGTLIFTGATGSIRGRPPFAAFAAAKAGVRSLSQTFAREFGPRGVHVAHVVIDGGIDGERIRARAPDHVAQLGADGLLAPDAIAEVYFQLHSQARSAWTQELDLRPFKETF
jgi:NAD(P)-dependent dehydrogenase (short-subunit alcohol dehydrogenase family)